MDTEAMQVLAELLAAKKRVAELEVKFELLTEAPQGRSQAVGADEPEDESPILPGVPWH